MDPRRTLPLAVACLVLAAGLVPTLAAATHGTDLIESWSYRIVTTLDEEEHVVVDQVDQYDYVCYVRTVTDRFWGGDVGVYGQWAFSAELYDGRGDLVVKDQGAETYGPQSNVLQAQADGVHIPLVVDWRGQVGNWTLQVEGAGYSYFDIQIELRYADTANECLHG